jgi:hypothetical protein
MVFRSAAAVVVGKASGQRLADYFEGHTGVRAGRRGLVKEAHRIVRIRLRNVELRLAPDEGWRRPPIQDCIHIVEGQHAHRRPGFDCGAADVRQ